VAGTQYGHKRAVTEKNARLPPNDVLNEQDVFRLVIRGHAAVEHAMRDALTDAFGGRLPSDPRVRQQKRESHCASVLSGTP
jgi:hypothetical protein